MTPTTQHEPQPWEALRVLREKDGYKKRELAARAGLSENYYGQLENGRREPNPRITKILATALNVPMSMLEKQRRQDGAA